MRRFHPIAAICVYLASLLPGPVQAWTAQEIRAMPPYCAGRYARNDNMAEYKRWEAQYGPDFIHTHHLCDGIGLLNNYHKARTPQEKRGLLNEVMGNLNYMVQHAKPDFKLMPEVYWYRSRVYHLMDQPGQAVGDLRKAIELDPKQARFYTQAAEYLEKLRQQDEALKLVSEGLRNLPDHKGLQATYSRLGGKLPYPEPYVVKNATSTVASGSGEAKSGIGRDMPKVPRSAIFDLSRNTGAARKEPGIINAGAYIFVEIKEDRAFPEIVHIRIQSQIPESAARIMSIAIDTGRYTGLFYSLEVKDPVLGKYYPPRPTGGAYTHAYYPKDFTPDFLAQFTIDAKEGKMYDPRALPPGSSLTMVARLTQGSRFEDVVEAVKLGLSSPEGLRFGVIAHHLMGYRPDPRKTIMDDAGFLTGALRQLQGFDEEPKPTSASSTPEARASVDETATKDTKKADNPIAAVQGQDTGPNPTPDRGRPPSGSPPNPWCRFCPEQPTK